MENEDLTYWTNYRTAMGWLKGDKTVVEPEEIVVESPIEQETVDDEELEFAIDDELLDFYRQTKDHRANRRSQKTQEKDEAEQIELIPGEQMRPNFQSISKLPPINRARLRQLELDWLYGSSQASKIHVRETEIQMQFDQLFDQKQPAYFPSLPNRLQLEPHLQTQQFRLAPVSIVDGRS